jgi:hypothetical protein
MKSRRDSPSGGKLAGLTIVDGDLPREPHLLSAPGRIW